MGFHQGEALRVVELLLGEVKGVLLSCFLDLLMPPQSLLRPVPFSTF